ncbi:AAA family ATPase [Rahnella laticis]|uniref:AAA family ATPase n=1 Tax=Rahnella laticis TaxID=2787622 RepID=UPI0018A3166C|nr:AAA family ATPase [Rahnella laticis]MBF7993398.1 AAA family ATPase [Rahnella laticis]
MIAGLFLRNFKSFKNQHYIPIMQDSSSSYFIGENGVGKSTVLSALNTVLNHNDINRLDINNEIRSQGLETREPFIVPVFLIEKSKVRRGTAMARILKVISNITWNLESHEFTSTFQRNIVDRFIEHKDNLAQIYDEKTFFLIPIGFIKKKANETPVPSMSIFESIPDYEEQLVEALEPFTTISWLKKGSLDEIKSKVLEFIKEFYSFIYLPAEITVDSYSKIEGELSQSLLGDDIQNKIQKIIKKKDIDEINKHLNEYIADVSSLLDNSYHFKKPSQRQTLFTQRHMILKIIETYFTDKILHRRVDGRDTPINNLSSGEKRKALLDLAFAFLKSNPKKSVSQTIFAIDEPELSLHATACFKQFEKLKKISDLGVQTLITTHWYGFLPVAGVGSATYISPNQTHIKLLNLRSFKEEISNFVGESKGIYLDTLEVKSTHDLVQSIIASITATNNYNWLLCEGKTDKNYLEVHLECENVENLIILPVGGSFALKDIYTYLTLALKDRRSTIKGKVYCLLDTDQAYNEFHSTDSITNLKIRRLLFNKKSGCIDLLKTTDNRVSPATEIEDALDGLFFYDTLYRLYEDGYKQFAFMQDIETLTCEVSAGILDITKKQQEIIQNYLDQPGMKVDFCNRYCSLVMDSEDVSTPGWILEIADFFSDENSKL